MGGRPNQSIYIIYCNRIRSRYSVFLVAVWNQPPAILRVSISGKIHWLCGMRIPIGSILLGCPGQEMIGSMGDWINGLFHLLINGVFLGVK